MMLRSPLAVLASVLVILSSAPRSGSCRPQDYDNALKMEYHLAGARSAERQFYLMETRVIEYAPDGERQNADTYRLLLESAPAGAGKPESIEYTCGLFTFRGGSGEEVSIPGLKGWKYTYSGGIDREGQVFSIDHARFEKLADSEGNRLPPDRSYLVYNTFIDFHSFCDVFAEPSDEGAGIQDLKRIGQRIVHSAAHSRPPVDLGGIISEGSYFQNGRITLELKGISRVDGTPCALVGYDSGESSYKMFMEPMPGMKVETSGSSHYMGDIYKDLETNWVRRVTMAEFVVSETRVPMQQGNIRSVVEREIIIRAVGKKEWNSIIEERK